MNLLNRHLTLRTLTLFSVLMISAWGVQAQDFNSETAGAELTRFEQEENQIDEFFERAKITQEKEDSIETSDQAGTKLEGDVRFILKEVDLVGNEIYPDDHLKPLYASYLNREVSLNDLNIIATAVKSYYRDNGYVAAFVYVAPQTIDDGKVEMLVVEGKLDYVEVQNNRWFSEKVLKKYLNVDEGRVLSADQLEGGLIFLNKHKDIKAKAFLKPGDEPQTTKILLDVEDQFPGHFRVDVNNLGTRNTGRTRVGFGAEYNNLLGQMDKLSARVQLGDGSVAVGADYNIPVHSSGTLVGFNYSHSEVEVGGDFAALNIEGNADTYGIYVLQPIIRRDWVEVTLNTGFDFKSVENTILGRNAGDDELRILNLGFNTEFTDRWGKTFNPHSFHIGFSSFLGGSDAVDASASRTGTGGQFFVYRSSLIRYHKLPLGMTYVFRGQLQLTNDRLAPIEQMRLGGAYAVRGYPEGEYLADYGAYMTNEVYIPTFFFPEDWKLPYAEKPMREQFQFTAFFDFGGGRLRGATATETAGRTLAGAGIGLRVQLFDHVYARIQWATPTGSHASNGSDTAFYYGITTEIF